MPRPTPAQLAYGTATVVLSTVAMLLLSEARSGVAVALIGVAGLALGTFVAATTAPARRTAAEPAARGAAARETAVREAADAQAGRAPGTRVRTGAAGPRVGEHSLRR